MYNICWCTLHNCMNPFCTIQLCTFLSLPHSDDKALNGISQGCIVWAVAADSQPQAHF